MVHTLHWDLYGDVRVVSLVLGRGETWAEVHQDVDLVEHSQRGCL